MKKMWRRVIHNMYSNFFINLVFRVDRGVENINFRNPLTIIP